MPKTMKCCYPGCRAEAIIPAAAIIPEDGDKWFCKEHFDAYLAGRRPPEDPAAKAEREDLLARERAYEELKSRVMYGRASADEVDLRFLARQNEDIRKELRKLSELSALSGIRDDLRALSEKVGSELSSLRHDVRYGFFGVAIILLLLLSCAAASDGHPSLARPAYTTRRVP